MSHDKIFTAEELGIVIRTKRKQVRISQIELAERANVSRSVLQKLEGRGGVVRLDIILKLLTALSLDLVVASRPTWSARD
ncbi:MAG: helix-turn-helix domain-containing protein [Candidatus Dormibacteraceae bacterium]